MFSVCFQWEWLTPLKDVKVTETESADFECEFSVADVNVTWTVKGEPVEASPKYSMTSEGKKHTLTVAKCRPRDEGEVTCSYSDFTTKANLNVKGWSVYTIVLFERKYFIFLRKILKY